MGSAGPSRLGSILRAISTFGTARGFAHSGSFPRALGTTEVQETSTPHDAGMGLAATRSSRPADPVRALGSGVYGWTIGAG